MIPLYMKGMIVINRQLKGSLYLVACSFVWGMAFVAQGSAMDHVQPATFVCARFAITCVVLGVASYLQQLGLVHTSPTNSGFVTALYIVLVPILSVFLGQKIRPVVWVGVALSLTGLYLLCVGKGFTVNPGDLITLGCAFVFSLHIITVDRLAGDMNPIKLSAIQFGVGALLAGIIALLFEDHNWAGLLNCMPSLLYAALGSGAIGYTLQIMGQKYTDPALASLIMCLEAVFAAVGEWLATRLGFFDGQMLDGRRLLGCALMLAASVVAQLPERKKSPRGNI